MNRGSPDPDWQRQRAAMVETQLVARGIRNPAVLAALSGVPREQFVPEDLKGSAYDDGALPIECLQTISQPYMVARMTELLELNPCSRVLEIGTGSGYQTAVLARLAARVFTIEWHLRLLNAAAERLERLSLANVTYRCGDGSLGWPQHAPYDAIIVTAGAPEVPPALPEQLAAGGRLVVPVGSVDEQVLVRVMSTTAGPQTESIIACRFVKLRGAAGWPGDRP